MAMEILGPTAHPDPVSGLTYNPRPGSLAGKRLGLVDNGKRNAAELLRHLAAAIDRQYPLTEVVLVTKPSASTGMPPVQAAELRERVDVALAGVGD